MRLAELLTHLRGLPGDCEVIVAMPTDTYEQLYVTAYGLAAVDIELDTDGAPQRTVIVASSHTAPPTTVGVWYRCWECGARLYVTEGFPPPWCDSCSMFFLVA